MELLDIIDEKDNITGDKVERSRVHELNLWHHHVFAWIMNYDGKILLQQRAFNKKTSPGKWSRTGGHVDAGETCDEAVKREVFEELGLTVSRIENIGKYKSFEEEHYITYGYIIFTNMKEEDYVVQKDEVNDIKYFTIEELEEVRKQKNKDFSLINWNDEYFNEQISLLKGYRNNLFEVRK